MKILSKYKDYYDYFQGIFGMDESKVYDRRKMVKRKDLDITVIEHSYDVLYFAICGKEYTLRQYKGKLYYTADEIKQMFDKINADKAKNLKRPLKSWEKIGGGWIPVTPQQIFERNGKPIKANHRLRRPILVGLANGNSVSWQKNTPLLATFDFTRVMEAKTLYIEVETFLGWLVDNPPLPDKQTNEGKIVSHGFDLKDSFRHRK